LGLGPGMVSLRLLRRGIAVEQVEFGKNGVGIVDGDVGGVEGGRVFVGVKRWRTCELNL
jgi:hypothetical protein